jgi:hypothetical protein
MRNATHLTIVLFLLTFSAACSGSSQMTPTAPSAPPPPPQSLQPTSTPPGPGSGTVTIREFSPNPGATLTVTDCPGIPATQRCAGQWRSTVDVLVDRDMTNAVLVMRFYEGDRLCGLSANTTDIVRAGIRETFILSSITLSSGDPGLKSPCQLPTRTTRIEVELWSDLSSWTNTLKMGLPSTYAFVSD